jgi:hypothetical protein
MEQCVFSIMHIVLRNIRCLASSEYHTCAIGVMPWSAVRH